MTTAMIRPIYSPCRPPSACPPRSRMALRRPSRKTVLIAFAVVIASLSHYFLLGDQHTLLLKAQRVCLRIDVDDDRIAFAELSAQQLQRERILDHPLDRAP